MGDVMGVIIMDDPVPAYGFFSNDCNNGIRTAINTKQYPCAGEIHDCGQLISGAVWDTMTQYKTDLRTAAMIIGVKRVADATVMRGIFP